MDFLCDLTTPPKFGGQDDELAPFRENKYVVVEVAETDSASDGWKPGFYLARVTLNEAKTALDEYRAKF